jgi:deoxyribonuclease V
VYDLTAQVPEGMVTTYGSIARALGDIKAARAVGEMEHENPQPIIVPCHRVVYSDGGLSGFGAPGGPETKKKFLEREGVTIRDGKVDDFESRLFTEFHSPHPAPLEKLRALQEHYRERVVLEDQFDSIETVCGIDVAYRGRSSFGAAVVFDYKTKTEIERVTSECNVNFPYIPTYLAFRELAPVMKVLESLSAQPTIIMLDGNGILHPRRFGIAAHIGITLDIPTLGAAKKPLCGTFDAGGLETEGDFVPIKLDGEDVGYALLSSPRTKKPIFISPGHNISRKTALAVSKEFTGQKMLTPIKEAHVAATEMARSDNRYRSSEEL